MAKESGTRLSDRAYAVEYGSKAAPTVMAKASGYDVEILIEAARDLRIPVIENPQLAALLEGVEIDEEIPEELYHSVAIVLSWVFWIRGEQPF